MYRSGSHDLVQQMHLGSNGVVRDEHSAGQRQVGHGGVGGVLPLGDPVLDGIALVGVPVRGDHRVLEQLLCNQSRSVSIRSPNYHEG